MPEKLKILDLFSGIGGFSLGLERTGGFETVAFCEIEPFPRKVLAKHWPKVPCYEDVKTIPRLGSIDLVCGGYPCQPFSTAGRRQGEKDDRHLWPAMFSIIQRERPSWVIGENVAGHVSMGLDDVLSDLESEGYSARTFIIPACAADAPHRRDRVWILANTSILQRDGGEYHRGKSKRQKPEPGNYGGANILANATSQRQSRQGQLVQRGSSTPDGKGQANKPFAVSEPRIWPTEPDVGGRLNGLSSWLDGLDLTASHELLMANGEENKRARKELYSLWSCNGAEALWKEVRGFRGIQPKAVLLTYLCQLEKRAPNQAWLQLARSETSESELRGLRPHCVPSCTPYRSGYYEQHCREHPNSLQALSRLLAHHAEKVWVEYCRKNAVPYGWEEGIARTANNIPNRMDRLKSLGNAVVPAVVERIGYAILEAEKGNTI